MKSNLSLLTLVVFLLSSALLAESPPANTIPVIGLKPAFVGTQYQQDSSYTPKLGDSLELWLIDHYEEVED